MSSVNQQIKKLSNPFALGFGSVLLSLLSSSVSASPWFESSDPFLRSSLTLLSDAQQISSPISTYPMRWSLFGDDLSNRDTSTTSHLNLPDFVILAKNELSYSLNTAKLNRGNKSFGIQASSTQLSEAQALLSNYGQADDNEWQVYSSVDYLSSSFAYRIKLSYQNDGSSEEVDWQDSYLALNAGQWLFTLGQLDYWWGQGWLHNLVLANYADPEPGLQASYINQNDRLGVWSFQALMLDLEDSVYDQHGAIRLSTKPWRNAELATTYQTWFSGSNGRSDQQIALDGRLTLPAWHGMYHSVYGELASTSEASAIGAWMIGWTGSVAIEQNTLRIVLESQQQAEDYQASDWHAGVYPSISDGVANTSYQLDNSYAIAFYLQRMNDHSIGVSYQSAESEGDPIQATKLSYRMPAWSGMLDFALTSMRDDSTGAERSQTNEWHAGYEFRF